MDKNRDAEASSPLATVEDIQKRLLRPSLTSQLWHDWILSHISSKSYVSLHTVLKKKKIQARRNHKLEDYLHPVLLSSARARIGGNRKNFHGAETKKIGVHEFDLFRWPGEEDQLELNELTGCFAASSTTRAIEDEYSAVDLSEN